LIGEHVRSLGALFRSFAVVLCPGGRLVFSTYHPWMAAAGKEAHFVRDGQEYGLGAEPHTVDDFVAAVEGAGFTLEERLEPGGGRGPACRAAVGGALRGPAAASGARGETGGGELCAVRRRLRRWKAVRAS
jgi:hypothetical protein